MIVHTLSSGRDRPRNAPLSPPTAGPPVRLLALGLAALAVACAGACAGPEPDPDSNRPPPDTSTDLGVFDEKGMALTLGDDGTLSLEVPIGNRGRTTFEGAISLTLEDLAGTRIASTQSRFTAGPGGASVPFTLRGLPAEVTAADLANYVIGYQVRWGEGRSAGKAVGSRSAFDALRKLAVVLMTEDEVELGEPSHVSLFVLDPATSRPLSGAHVELVVAAADGATTSTPLVTDEAGQAAAEVPLPPSAVEGDATLTVRVTHGDQVTHEDVPVRVVRSRKVLLTTDKPLYQPGQTVHVRALALKPGDKTPEAEQPIVFEVEDGSGNLILREAATTDAFGIASTTLAIARQVNLGSWKVRAVIGGVTSEKTITVDRYVLPKFKVDVALDATWYRPSAAVEVTGEARYFFGQPVANGVVRIVGSTFDVDFTPFVNVDTLTDADGRFSATLQVPAHVVGLPLSQGKGLMKVDVAVTDGADHTQVASKSASVAKGAVDVALVPESGRLVAGVDNTLYVVTTDPNGGPVPHAQVTIADDGATLAELTTDGDGLGQVTIVPEGSGSATFEVEVTGGGETLSLQRTISLGADGETVLVRTDKAVYRTGDTVEVEVRIADAADRVWLDLVHDGRTSLLEALTVEGGVARWAFDVDATLGGELLLSAYTVTDRGTIVRDQKLLYVQPDDELKVALTPREERYRPGEQATVDVAVTDKAGNGVAAAVGLQVVDEAVFALQESQPGLLKVFFDLARELATPIVSPGCGGCDATTVIRGDESDSPVYDAKARVAFAALGDTALHGVEKNTFTAMIQAVQKVLQPRLDAERQRILQEIQDLATGGAVTWDNIDEMLTRDDVAGVDFWGWPYAVTADGASQQVRYVTRGPDERAGTVDDLTFQVGYSEAMYASWGWGGERGGEWGEGDFAGQPNAGGPMPGAMPDDDTDQDGVADGGDGGGAIKVRQDFPETLYVNPALITDGAGKAELSLDLADSITTWRMTGLASAKSGLLGSGTGGLLVFQDFFVDVDFPVAMTRGDRMTLPVALYNYLPTAQAVTVELEQASIAEWLEVEGATTKSLTLQPGEVTAVKFVVRATAVGTRGLTVIARGASMSDAVRRTVQVRPDGKPMVATASARFAVGPAEVDGGRTSETVTRTISVPAANIDGAQGLMVKVYPGFMSQVVDGIDSLLRMPGGCFEQTTSSAWPNVLVTDYLGKTGALKPETEIKARTYIVEGYQRLLTFECASGGFNWWEGDDPGNAVLSAVGIMMFTDTKRVAFVDDDVIVRAAKYLAATQQSDGSWTEERHLHAGNENLGAGSARATAYITWALLQAEREPATIAKGIQHLRGKVSEVIASDDVYTIALMTLALALNDGGDSALPGLVAALHEARVVGTGDEATHVHWSPAQATMVGGYNDSGDIETTALVSLALMEANAHRADVQGALAWLLAHKDPQGNWGYSTQATVLTLKALIASLSAGAETTDATVRVLLDGQLAGQKTFSDFDADVMWQLDLGESLGEGEHEVTLEYAGVGNLMWQVTDEHWLPWSEAPVEPPGPLSIEVSYDKTQLAADDVVTVTVTVANSDPNTTGMMMAELGLPPGFDLDTSLLDAVLGHGQVARYERTALKLVVYLEPVVAGQPVTFQYALRAEHPLEATAPESETYLYYDKSVRAGAEPVTLTVQ